MFKEKFEEMAKNPLTTAARLLQAGYQIDDILNGQDEEFKVENGNLFFKQFECKSNTCQHISHKPVDWIKVC